MFGFLRRRLQPNFPDPFDEAGCRVRGLSPQNLPQLARQPDMGADDKTSESGEKAWPDVGCLTEVLEQCEIKESRLTQPGEPVWTAAHDSFAASLSPATALTLTKSYKFDCLPAGGSNTSCMLIQHSGQFQLLSRLKLKCAHCRFSVSLLHVGDRGELLLASDQVDKWVPLQPVPLRDVKYIVIRLDAGLDSAVDCTFELSLTRLLEPVLRARLEVMALKAEVEKGKWLYLPAHPTPFLRGQPKE